MDEKHVVSYWIKVEVYTSCNFGGATINRVNVRNPNTKTRLLVFTNEMKDMDSKQELCNVTKYSFLLYYK